MGKRTKIILGSIIVILIIFRLFLPDIVLHYVNKELNNMEEYKGNVKDIDIALFRGAYVIDGITILKRDTEDREVSDSIPFFSSPRIDLSVQWNALFQGKIVGELVVDHPKLNFVNTEEKDPEVKQDTSDFKGLIGNLMPLNINSFEVKQAQIHYIDNLSSPKVDVFIEDLNINAGKLTNQPVDGDSLPSNINANGKTYKGNFNLDVNLNALAENPTFDMNAEIENLDMVGLNDFLRAYGNFDVKEGEFNLYTEFAAKNGDFKGYIKPLVKNLNIVQWNKEEGNVPQRLWESLVAVTEEIFENQKQDQIGSKVMIENTFDDPNIDVGSAILFILKNAFIQALKPSIEESITIDKMEKEEKDQGFFKELFDGDGK